MRQFGSGYVLERITKTFGEPNQEFADDPQIQEDRKQHAEVKDCLVAVHRLRTSSRPLAEIIGQAEFDRLQDFWAVGGDRRRWSVAFPIVESYEIIGKPPARKVFDDRTYKRLYQSQSATLRILDGAARDAIPQLEIKLIHAANSWIAIEDEIIMAERSDVPRNVERLIIRDLAGALEGEVEERRSKIRRRASWIAHKFIRQRQESGQLKCDDCGFDPSELPDSSQIRARSCLDVHHVSPLDEGLRYTTTSDFTLLCPTCHRIAHLRIKAAAS